MSIIILKHHHQVNGSKPAAKLRRVQAASVLRPCSIGAYDGCLLVEN
jgi:hypothetical protein